MILQLSFDESCNLRWPHTVREVCIFIHVWDHLSVDTTNFGVENGVKENPINILSCLINRAVEWVQYSKQLLGGPGTMKVPRVKRGKQIFTVAKFGGWAQHKFFL